MKHWVKTKPMFNATRLGDIEGQFLPRVIIIQASQGEARQRGRKLNEPKPGFPILRKN